MGGGARDGAKTKLVHACARPCVSTDQDHVVEILFGMLLARQHVPLCVDAHGSRAMVFFCFGEKENCLVRWLSWESLVALFPVCSKQPPPCFRLFVALALFRLRFTSSSHRPHETPYSTVTPSLTKVFFSMLVVVGVLVLFAPLPLPSRRQMGLGIAESLADLYGKLTVAQRQLDGASSTKGGGKKAAEKSRKIQSLESQV